MTDIVGADGKPLGGPTIEEQFERVVASARMWRGSTLYLLDQLSKIATGEQHGHPLSSRKARQIAREAVLKIASTVDVPTPEPEQPTPL